MPIATIADAAKPDATIDLCYEEFGPSDAAPMVLVMGFTAQMIVWPQELVDQLVDAGFRVIRFDNRDCGLSSKSDGPMPDIPTLFGRHLAGDTITPDEVPYTLAHMAADTVALLDHLGIERAHVAGASMGGMIVQELAIRHADRLLSATSIMSTTGDTSVGGASPEAMGALLAPPPEGGRDAVVEQNVATGRIIAGPLFDEARSRDLAGRTYDRSFHPPGAAFQMAAIAGSGNRTEALRSVDLPFLVIHGEADELIAVSGGHATAAAVPDADLLVLARMGHDLPLPLLPQIVAAITTHATRPAPATV